jgi:hypothetical protein
MRYQFAYPVVERPDGTVCVGSDFTQFTSVVRGTVSRPVEVPLEFLDQGAFRAWLSANGIAYMPRTAVPPDMRFGQAVMSN